MYKTNKGFKSVFINGLQINLKEKIIIKNG